MNIGIDIGSTASKVIVMDEGKEKILYKLLMPTGWNSKETSEAIRKDLEARGYDVEHAYVTATGYGRVSVPYADKVITEISTHAKGAVYLFGGDCNVIDIGGQDTKLIIISQGMVSDFIMNDKCSAGTGKFLEIMSNRLGVSLGEMFELASKGEPINISSICTVFAESEVISLIGSGTPKEDIACGVVNSIANKVVGQVNRGRNLASAFFLTGGFADNAYMLSLLSKLLKTEVKSHEMGRFAGAIGAAMLGKYSKS